MDKTFDEAIAGIRKAERGVEAHRQMIEQFHGAVSACKQGRPYRNRQA